MIKRAVLMEGNYRTPKRAPLISFQEFKRIPTKKQRVGVDYSDENIWMTTKPFLEQKMFVHGPMSHLLSMYGSLKPLFVNSLLRILFKHLLQHYSSFLLFTMLKSYELQYEFFWNSFIQIFLFNSFGAHQFWNQIFPMLPPPVIYRSIMTFISGPIVSGYDFDWAFPKLSNCTLLIRCSVSDKNLFCTKRWADSGFAWTFHAMNGIMDLFFFIQTRKWVAVCLISVFVLTCHVL